jgi:hypothetical protein
LEQGPHADRESFEIAKVALHEVEDLIEINVPVNVYQPVSE